MFGRAKEKTRSQQAGATAPDGAAGAQEVKPGGKGRPTPTRQQAQARNRRPLVPADRKAAGRAARAAMREQRLRMQQALATGDERYFPPRDRGPQRRLARDVVDARRNIGEYFLYVAFGALLLSVVTQATGDLALTAGATVLIYLMLAAVIVDSVLIARRVKRLATERFGHPERGLVSYAISRALQMRRLRRPIPAVGRGEPPR